MSDSTSEHDGLRARARERIEQEQLPRTKPARVWGGHGTGSSCALCDQPILGSEAEMELEYEGGQNIHFHLRCQAAWDLARQAQSTPSGWISIAEQLPPLHTIVEARLRLNERRTVILNVMRVCDGKTGPIIWFNATTNGQLPEHWAPVEWRPTSRACQTRPTAGAGAG